MSSLESLVKEWLRLDQNEFTHAKIKDLYASGNYVELEKRMRKRIEFGTAGLRGRMEAGWSRMNDLIIIQASQGLCAYVLQTVPNASSRGVVVGHDHRHHSEKWAKLTAAAFVANGVKVYLLNGLVHTPLVPFSVKRLDAACGVMITASHNPKDDNGYKVYWENAVQIIAPHDKGISNAIKANLEPKTWDIASTTSSPLCIDRTEEMREAYFDYLSSLCLRRSHNGEASLKFVNTSMHGVSHPFMVKAFDIFGFPAFVPVREQQQPDPDFPTVKFPNPEEKGALDLALRTAGECGADYVLAQDPDADRFSAAERGPDGQWIPFTGDQLGILFASTTLERYKATGKPLHKLAMVASTVSSRMIEAMANTEGFKFVECLTGFKFIGNSALKLQEEGYEVLFGYEEAIGYMFGSEIRDKDGVSASVMFAEMASALHTQGKTASSHLRDLYDRYGYFQTSNSYFICSDPPTIDRIFARIRNYDGKGTPERPSYPPSIASHRVTRVRDLTVGYDSGTAPTYKPVLPLSSGHMIQIWAQSPTDGTSITLTLRTSGTEPKIKYYLEGIGKNAEQVGLLLPKVVQELGDEWMEAKKNGLGLA
ncbi:phosphoglucomutase 1 [Wolfiporia cocos MD-104 SS10]|uniref:Phosphoglucomutase 1 n=1 Tax=Wolfiporia cocos (strain MD-104) TaxID=742152 RepID=A0A2H3J9J7_WOLCO|nr:phosphoglucomutase 1 [Wolfiporia cocos MD-104 SS10]